MIRRSTLIVVGLFIAVLALAIYLQRTGKKLVAETPTPTQPAALLSLERDSIGRLQIEASDGRIVELERAADGTWRVLQPKNEAADASTIDSALTNLLSLSITSAINPPPPASSTGLDRPQYVIRISSEGSGDQAIQVGNVTPVGSGYYVKLEDGRVLVTGKFGVDEILKLVLNPPYALTVSPEITSTAEGETLPAASSTPVP